MDLSKGLLPARPAAAAGSPVAVSAGSCPAWLCLCAWLQKAGSSSCSSEHRVCALVSPPSGRRRFGGARQLEKVFLVLSAEFVQQDWWVQS